MSAPDTADHGRTARSLFHTMVVPPRRRRTVRERATMALRDHAGMGVFVVMLIACAALVLFSR